MERWRNGVAVWWSGRLAVVRRLLPILRCSIAPVLLLSLAGCSSEPPPSSDPAAQSAQSWINQLESSGPELREQAIAKLAAIEHPVVVEPLIATARFDNQRQLRIAALRALAASKFVTDPAPLLTLVQDPDAQIRAETCEMLGRLKAASALEALAGCLQDSQLIVRIAAVHALGKLGPAGVDRVDQLLKSGRVEDRITVVEVAGRSGDRSRLPLLIDALKAEEDTLRRAAAEALGKLKDPSAIEPLVALIRDPVSRATLAVMHARANQAPTHADRALMVQILDEDQLAAGRTAEGMRAHGWVMTAPPASLRGLFARVIDRQQRDTLDAVRRVAVEAIDSIGSPAAQSALADLLADADPAVNRVVSQILTKTRRSNEPLFALLADPKRPGPARLRALDLLLAHNERPDEVVSNDEILMAFDGKSDDPILLPLPGGRVAPRKVPLGERLTGILKEGLNDPDLSVRLRFARELAQRQVPEAADCLVELVKLSDPAVLLPAIQGLSCFNDTRPVPRLLELLKDPAMRSLQGAIVIALGASRDQRAVEALLPLATKESSLQGPAIQALTAIGDPSAGKVLLDYFPNASEGAKPLLVAAFGACRVTESVPVLVNMLKSPGRFDDIVVNALGDLRDPQAFEVVVGAIGRSTYHERSNGNALARAGIVALTKIGDVRAVPLFEKWVRVPPDPAILEYAADALGKMPRVEAVDALVRLLVDPSLERAVKEASVGPALVTLGPVAKPQLMRLLTGSPAPTKEQTFDPGIYAAQLVGAMGPVALTELQQAVQGAPKHVLARIVEAAGKIADDRAVEILGEVARHADPQVRQWAVVALGRTRQTTAVKVLQNSLSDPDPEVLRWTRWALEQQGVKQS